MPLRRSSKPKGTKTARSARRPTASKPFPKPKRFKSLSHSLEPLGPDTTRPIALAAVEAALDKKAEQPVLLDVRRVSSYADYVLLLSTESERQVEAVSRAIEQRLSGSGGKLRGIESAGESNWLLMDFGDLVVHIFFRDARSFYDLEGLWSDAPRVPIEK
jgi:ribosome-associated protein